MIISFHLWSYISQFLLEWELLQTKVVEKINIRILCPIIFSENPAFYETTWKNTVDLERLQITIWWRRISYWKHEFTNTHSEYVWEHCLSVSLRSRLGRVVVLSNRYWNQCRIFCFSAVFKSISNKTGNLRKTECDIVLPLSIYSILSFPEGHPVAAYVFFFVFPSLIFFLLSFLQ